MREQDLRKRKYPGVDFNVLHLGLQIECLRNATCLEYSAVELVRLRDDKGAKPARRGLAGATCENYLRLNVFAEADTMPEKSRRGNVNIPRLRPEARCIYR